MVYTALAITAAAGAYYYYAGGTDAPRNRARSAQTEEMMARKARESLQTGRAHAEEIQEKTKGKYNEAKVGFMFSFPAQYLCGRLLGRRQLSLRG